MWVQKNSLYGQILPGRMWPGQMSPTVGICYRWSQEPDMEKGADARTLSAEFSENCGNIWIMEDYSPIFSEKTLHIVEIFD